MCILAQSLVPLSTNAAGQMQSPVENSNSQKFALPPPAQEARIANLAVFTFVWVAASRRFFRVAKLILFSVRFSIFAGDWFRVAGDRFVKPSVS